MSWIDANCFVTTSESIYSKDKSKIYSIFTYGGIESWMFFVSLNSTNLEGIDLRYQSGSDIAGVMSWALYGDYVVFSSTQSTTSYYFLHLYNTINSNFITYRSFYYVLTHIDLEPVSGR